MKRLIHELIKSDRNKIHGSDGWVTPSLTVAAVKEVVATHFDDGFDGADFVGYLCIEDAESWHHGKSRGRHSWAYEGRLPYKLILPSPRHAEAEVSGQLPIGKVEDGSVFRRVEGRLESVEFVDVVEFVE